MSNTETLSDELTRLVREYRKYPESATGVEAWNYIADFVIDNSGTITAALQAAADAPPPQTQEHVLITPEDYDRALGYADAHSSSREEHRELMLAGLAATIISKNHASKAPPSPHLAPAARAFMDLFVVDNGEDRGQSTAEIDMVELTHRFAALEDALASAPPPQVTLHGPYGWLIKPIGLAEDAWYLATDPSEHPDEEVSVPLFAKEEQALGNTEGTERG